mgnify:CR=1 FL=1
MDGFLQPPSPTFEEWSLFIAADFFFFFRYRRWAANWLSLPFAVFRYFFATFVEIAYVLLGYLHAKNNTALYNMPDKLWT